MLVKTNEHPLACKWREKLLKGNREGAKCEVAHSGSPLLRLQLPPKLLLHVEPTLATFQIRHISNRQKHGGHRNIRDMLGDVLDEFDQISLCAFLEAETQQEEHWQRTLLELSGQFVSSCRTSFCFFLRRIFPRLRDRTIAH